MPTYRYRAKEPESVDCEYCTNPGFETVQTLSEDPIAECPQCKAAVRRVIGRVENWINRRWNTKKMLSDGNLKRLGFKKLEKQSDGKYVDVLQQ